MEKVDNWTIQNYVMLYMLGYPGYTYDGLKQLMKEYGYEYPSERPAGTGE